MNPSGAMRGQALTLMIAVALGTLTCLWPISVGMLGTALGAAAILNTAYGRRLSTNPRRTTRVDGDREVGGQLCGLLLVGIGGTTATLILDSPLTDSVQVAWSLQLAVAFCSIMYASSLVDWYWIRPRRDGVIVEPPCRTSNAPHWVDVTRWWYRHRCAAAFGCFTAAAGAAGFFALAIVHPGADAGALPVAGTFFAAAAVAERLMARFNSSLTEVGHVVSTCVFNPPDHAIGQRLTSDTDAHDTFVRDVAVEAVVRVPLGVNQLPIPGRSVVRTPVEDIVGVASLRRTTYTGCSQRCTHVNADCEWIDPALRPVRRGGLFVFGRDVDARTGQRMNGYEDRQR